MLEGVALLFEELEVDEEVPNEDEQREDNDASEDMDLLSVEEVLLVVLRKHVLPVHHDD